MKRTREQIKGIHNLLNHVILELNTSYRNSVYLEAFNDLTEVVNEIYEIEENQNEEQNEEHFHYIVVTKVLYQAKRFLREDVIYYREIQSAPIRKQELQERLEKTFEGGINIYSYYYKVVKDLPY